MTIYLITGHSSDYYAGENDILAHAWTTESAANAALAELTNYQQAVSAFGHVPYEERKRRRAEFDAALPEGWLKDFVGDGVVASDGSDTFTVVEVTLHGEVCS